MKIEINSHLLSVTLFGRTLSLRRRYATKKMEERIIKEGPLAVCLSVLYKNQGWLQDIHQRSAEFGEDIAIRVPMPRRKSRIPYWSAGHADENDKLFAANALGFEFGGDFKVPTFDPNDPQDEILQGPNV